MSLVLHVLPIGLSINEGIDDKQFVTALNRVALAGVLHPDASRTRGGSTRPVRDAIVTATHDTILDLARLLDPVAGMIRGLRGRPELCAEWTSVQAELDQPPAGDPDQGHAYVLIATDTEPGLRTATMVAAGLAGKHVVRYVGNPSEPDFRATVIRPDEVYLCRVPGLDFTQPADITELTWRALGSIGHVVASTAVVPQPHRWRVVVHLSGGFKALIPHLLVVTEGINSVFQCRDRTSPHAAPEIRAVVLHEHSNGKRVEVPIRALRGLVYQDLLTLVRHVHQGTVDTITDSTLFGLCLTDPAALTTLGEIMVAIP